MDVSGGKTVTIIANSAIHSDKISLAKAEAARDRAENILREKHSQREALLAEAELRRAIMEIGDKTKSTNKKIQRIYYCKSCRNSSIYDFKFC